MRLAFKGGVLPKRKKNLLSGVLILFLIFQWLILSRKRNIKILYFKKFKMPPRPKILFTLLEMSSKRDFN